MRVAVNAGLLYSAEVRGWTRYTLHLLKALTLQGVDVILLSRVPVHPSHLDILAHGRVTTVVAPSMRYLTWEQRWIPRTCREQRADVYHCMHNFGVPLYSTVPRVLTLHDAIDAIYYQDRLSYRAWLRIGLMRNRLMHQLARRFADRILTVSHHAKTDIVKRYGLPDDRIDVVYEAADENFHAKPSPMKTAEVAARYGLAKPYLFYVGGFEGRKNIGFLLKAFAEANLDGVELVLAGGGPASQAPVKAEAAQLGIGDRVRFTGFVSDDDLPALYSGALGYAYPSEYEGFGLQLVEAMAAGCPVLAANRTALPEVLGRGGDVFPLESTDTLAGQLRRLADDPAYRGDLKARALVRSRDFSWDRAASETIAVYKKALVTT